VHELAMAADEALKHPTVAFDETDDLAHLHLPMLAAVSELDKMATRVVIN
jgi:hypothetical protein